MRTFAARVTCVAGARIASGPRVPKGLQRKSPLQEMRPASYDLATATLELGLLTANARGGKNASVTLHGNR